MQACKAALMIVGLTYDCLRYRISADDRLCDQSRHLLQKSRTELFPGLFFHRTITLLKKD